MDVEIVLENYSNQDPNLEERADQREVLQNLAQAVDALPFIYRAVISLRYDADLKYEEIAAVLTLPLNTIRTHLRRAKQILRKRIEEASHG